MSLRDALVSLEKEMTIQLKVWKSNPGDNHSLACPFGKESEHCCLPSVLLAFKGNLRKIRFMLKTCNELALPGLPPMIPSYKEGDPTAIRLKRGDQK